MRRGFILLLVCFLLGLRSMAADLTKSQADIFGTEKLFEGMDNRTKDLMSAYSPVKTNNLSNGMLDILMDALKQSDGYIKQTAGTMSRILAIVIICKLVSGSDNPHSSNIALLAGSAAITACCISDVKSMVGLGKEVVTQINGFTSLLLPVMAAATSASGAPSSGGAIYAVSMVACDMLVRLSRVLIFPVIYVFLALGMIDSAIGQNKLSKIRELLGWSIKIALKIIIYLFTGLLAITGVISGATDAATLKATKLAISGMIPVVGSIVSDASSSLLAGASLLRGTIGTFGMLAVFAMFMLPFLRMAISYLGFKLTSAACEIVGSGYNKLLESICASMGYILAIVGCSTIMSVISCCSFVKIMTP